MKGSQSGDLSGDDGLLEGNTDEALGGEIVNLVGLNTIDQANAGGLIGEVVFFQKEIGVVLDSKFFNPPEVDGARSAVGAVNLIAFFEQQLGKVGAVLAGNAGDDCNRHNIPP